MSDPIDVVRRTALPVETGDQKIVVEGEGDLNVSAHAEHAVAVEALGPDFAGRGGAVHVASVATAFPSGRSSLEVKLADTRLAVEAGALTTEPPSRCEPGCGGRHPRWRTARAASRPDAAHLGTLVVSIGNLTVGELAYWLLAKRRPTPGQRTLFEAVLVSLADHGFTPY